MYQKAAAAGKPLLPGAAGTRLNSCIVLDWFTGFFLQPVLGVTVWK